MYNEKILKILATISALAILGMIMVGKADLYPNLPKENISFFLLIFMLPAILNVFLSVLGLFWIALAINLPLSFVSVSLIKLNDMSLMSLFLFLLAVILTILPFVRSIIRYRNKKQNYIPKSSII